MGDRQKITRKRDADLRHLEEVADWLDSRFVIPGTNLRFGVDFLLGVLPGVGDGVTALPALYLVYRASQLGIPKRIVMRMLLNVLVDVAVGAIPFLGDLFDFAFKANRRNIALLKRYIRN